MSDLEFASEDRAAADIAAATAHATLQAAEISASDAAAERIRKEEHLSQVHATKIETLRTEEEATRTLRIDLESTAAYQETMLIESQKTLETSTATRIATEASEK